MRPKEEVYQGKTEEDMKGIGLDEFAKMANSRVKRSLKRGLTDVQKKLLKKIEAHLTGERKKPVKTHSRDMPIIPQMLGAQIHIYNGKSFSLVDITVEKLGHYLGEFAQTRGKVSHKAPGVGATRSSKHVSVK